MGHRLGERGLEVLACGEFLAEAENHQERVVDRDAETDQRDQELHDDRDVCDVRQAPDERERVQDRGQRNRQRHRDGGNRSEDEEQDDERPTAADQGLGEHARAAAAAARRILEREQSRQVRRHAGRRVCRERRPNVFDVHVLGEVVLAGRIDLREGGVPVLRQVHGVVRVHVGAHTRARIHCRRPVDGPLQVHLGDVAVRMEDRDERRPFPGPEGLQHFLVRLVRRVAGNRERLEPAMRDLGRGERAEDRQDHPEADDDCAPSVYDVRETS